MPRAIAAANFGGCHRRHGYAAPNHRALKYSIPLNARVPKLLRNSFGALRHSDPPRSKTQRYPFAIHARVICVPNSRPHQRRHGIFP